MDISFLQLPSHIKNLKLAQDAPCRGSSVWVLSLTSQEGEVVVVKFVLNCLFHDVLDLIERTKYKTNTWVVSDQVLTIGVHRDIWYVFSLVLSLRRIVQIFLRLFCNNKIIILYFWINTQNILKGMSQGNTQCNTRVQMYIGNSNFFEVIHCSVSSMTYNQGRV